MTDPSIATAADYADALIVARRAKNWLFLILLLVLLVHICLFFVARYTDFFTTAPTVTATTKPLSHRVSPIDGFHYLTGITTFFGTILPILLSSVLLIIVNIMLVGRLIGVARVTSAYVWSILLILLLFPWQAFLGKVPFYSEDFRIPGVLFTWDELAAEAHFTAQPFELALMRWARFLVFPLLALILLMLIQGKSNRGLRQALGESTAGVT